MYMYKYFLLIAPWICEEHSTATASSWGSASGYGRSGTRYQQPSSQCPKRNGCTSQTDGTVMEMIEIRSDVQWWHTISLGGCATTTTTIPTGGRRSCGLLRREPTIHWENHPTALEYLVLCALSLYLFYTYLLAYLQLPWAGHRR